MATQQERREQTRTRLLRTARDHFSRHGYEGTRTEDILRATGLSRGALYHHFDSKDALFEAVFEVVSNETINLAVAGSTGIASPIERLATACIAWLRAALQPDSAAILLEIGPRVLGWQRVRAMESRTTTFLIRQTLEAAVAASEASIASIELTADMVNAMMEAVALSAMHENPAASPEQQEASIRQILGGLRTPC